MEPTPADAAAIAVEPRDRSAWLDEAVVAGGGRVAAPAEASGLVWTHEDAPAALEAVLAEHPQIRWVQLPWAGVEPYVEVIRARADRTWACGKGAYAEPVAEHALALALAGLRNLDGYARATEWTGQRGRNLLGARVVVVGGGGITVSFLRLLAPFGCSTTVVRRTQEPLEGADAVVPLDRLDEALRDADLVVLAVALTPETTGLLDGRRLRLLAPDAWVVNVARGAHIVTADLVDVLAEGAIGGAALDVTDPEPLPAGHPLWTEPRCLITPHTANTATMAVPLLSARVLDNVRRALAGEHLEGIVDPEAGY